MLVMLNFLILNRLLRRQLLSKRCDFFFWFIEVKCLLSESSCEVVNKRGKRKRNGVRAPKAAYFNKIEERRVRGNRHARRHENSKKKKKKI